MLGKKKDREGTELVGNIIKVKMFKSRLSKEGKEVEVKLSFEHGLDRYYGLLDLAEKYGLVKKVSTRVEMPGGAKVYAKQVYKDPTKYFTEEFLTQLDECAKNEYMYGINEDEGSISDTDVAREDESSDTADT